jgi:hypothetical protein
MIMFENRVMRKVSEPKGEEETGGWNKLYNENLHNLYFSSYILRAII